MDITKMDKAIGFYNDIKKFNTQIQIFTEKKKAMQAEINEAQTSIEMYEGLLEIAKKSLADL